MMNKKIIYMMLGLMSSNVSFSGFSDFLNNIRCLKIDKVKKKINSGMNINKQYSKYSGTTPLIYACENRSDKVAELLINLKADVNLANDYGMTPLMAAAKEGSLETFSLLIKAKANLDLQSSLSKQTALMIASRFNHFELVKLLIESKANLNLQEKDGNTALMLSSRYNNDVSVAIIKLLIVAGTDIEAINLDNCSALMIAIKGGFLEAVKLLIDAHANLNLRDKNNQTALMLACKDGQVEMVKLLLKAQLNLCSEVGVQQYVNLNDNSKDTALFFASTKNDCVIDKKDNISRRIEIVRLLIESGANLGWVNINKKSALMNLNEKALLGTFFGNDDNLLHLISRFIVSCKDSEKDRKINCLKNFLLVLLNNPVLIADYNKDGKTPLDIDPKVVIALFAECVGSNQSYLSRIKDLNKKILQANKDGNLKEVAKLIITMNEINLDKNWWDYLPLNEGNRK